MNRLEKKCFVTVATAHGLLLVILLVGPAFFTPSDKNDSFKQITVFSAADISKALTSGGTPQNVRAIPLPPPPTPTEQPQVTTPKPPEIPPTPKEEPKPVVKDIAPKEPTVKLTPHGDEPAPKKTRPRTTLTDDDLAPTKADKTAQKKAADEAKAHARAVAAAAAAKEKAELAKAFGNALNDIKHNTSGDTVVRMPVGIGGGGQASVNYRDVIASKFYEAWNPSFNLSEDTPDVTVSITISRDGSCRGHITKHSGNSNMDKSVQNALDIVTFIAPFPDSFTEQQMTVPVVFNLRVKRQ